jgi:methyl-accepting chemotaxis protein
MNVVRDLSIRTKLLGGFGLTLALSVVLGVLLLVQLGSVNAGGVYIATNSLPSIEVIDQIRADENAFRAEQLHNIVNVSTTLALPIIAGANADATQIEADFHRYQAMISNARDAHLLASARAQWAAYVTATARLMLASSNTTQPRTVALADSSAATFAGLSQTISEWTALNDGLASSNTTANASTYSSARALGIGLLAVMALVSAAIALLLTRMIKRGTDEMLRAAEGIAEGDVDQQITLTSGDELGQTAAAFRRMVDYLRELAGVAERLAKGDLTVEPVVRSERDLLGNALHKLVTDLRTVIGQVSGSAGQVSSASEQMSATSEESGRATGEIAHAIGEIASGAERQVQMVEQAKLAAEEVGRSVSEAADSAQRTAAVAHQAQELAHSGVAAAEQANAAMSSVRESSAQASETIHALAGKSEQIGQIVATITAIAEQTNLLALNAAIEAARAGDQGRGFAVVAEEVRKLAEESQHAAQEISQLVAAIQGETSRAVDVVAESARRSEDGTVVVEQTREAFLQIGTSVQDIVSRVEEIASAAQHVAVSAQTVQDAITEVANVAEESSAATEQVSASTEETSASAEQIAASAQELSGNAQELNQLVAQFKLTTTS